MPGAVSSVDVEASTNSESCCPLSGQMTLAVAKSRHGSRPSYREWTNPKPRLTVPPSPRRSTRHLMMNFSSFSMKAATRPSCSALELLMVQMSEHRHDE